MLREVGSVLVDLVPLVSVRVQDDSHHLGEARTAVSILMREIGSTEKRLSVRKEEHGEWPPAAARHGLNSAHIDLVQIRPFFTIDLDAHEIIAHDFRDILVL